MKGKTGVNDSRVADEVGDEEKDVLGVCLGSCEVHCDFGIDVPE